MWGHDLVGGEGEKIEQEIEGNNIKGKKEKERCTVRDISSARTRAPVEKKKVTHFPECGSKETRRERLQVRKKNRGPKHHREGKSQKTKSLFP